MADGDDKHIALALATSACVKVRTIEKTCSSSVRLDIAT